MGNGKKRTGVGCGPGTAKTRKVNPCPIPRGCEDKDPQEYKTWGTHQLPIKKYGELDETIESLIDAHAYNISFRKEKRKDVSSCAPSLSRYEVELFQVNHMGEQVKEETSGQIVDNESWRYTCWEYKEPLDRQKLSDEEKVEYDKEYRITKKLTDSWTGDGNNTKCSTSTSPIDQGERVYVEGRLMQEGASEDYTIDRTKGELQFTKPPPDWAEIRAYYSVTKEGPGDPKKGASLEYAIGKNLIDTFKGDGGETFTLSSPDVIEDSVQVFVKGEFKHRGVDYLIRHKRDKLLQKIFWIEFMKPPAHGEEITVSYEDIFTHGDHDYKEVDVTSFEAAKKRALECVEVFSKLFKNANSDWYEKPFRGRTDPEEIKNWIEKWSVPFPSRVLKEKNALKKVEYTCVCEKCNQITKPVILNYGDDIKETCQKKDSKGVFCGGKLKVTNFLDIYNIENEVYVSWETDIQIQNQIKEEVKKPCDAEPLALFFKVDKPIPGRPTAETEQEILNDPQELKKVALNLAKQLRKIKNAGAHPMITFWGYADKSAGCEYNEALSLRRAEWVQYKIEDILKTYGIQLPVNFAFGCGKGYADLRTKSGGYKADAHRAVIIELDELR